MIEFSGIAEGLALLANWNIVLMIVLGLVFGIVTGAIPGFSTPLAISIMLPVTYAMNPLAAIVFLTAIYGGGNFGASISAILLNIPGSPQAIVTGLDGYPLTQQGRASEALGTSVAASATGNLIGSFFLILVMPLIVVVALMFGPPEMFLVGVVGLTVISTLHHSFLKAMIAGMFGVLIGTIGMTSTGAIRGTYGLFELMDGLPIIPALVGLIGFSELFYMLQKTYVAKGGGAASTSSWALLYKGYRTAFRYPVALLRSSAIGVVIGALPGAGATIASVVSYNEARRYSKRPQDFGKGSSEGLLSAESANNASEGGALAIMLSLGIPGGLATAVLIGALMLQGLIPGPRLFMENPGLLYGVMLSQFLTSFLLLGIGLLLAFFAAPIVNIPTRVLIPVIAVFSIVGTYAIKLVMFDVVLMLIFAGLGILLRRHDYPLIAVVLGIVLGPILDRQLLRTFQTFGDLNPGILLDRPVSLILLGLLVFSTLPLLLRGYRRLRAMLAS